MGSQPSVQYHFFRIHILPMAMRNFAKTRSQSFLFLCNFFFLFFKVSLIFSHFLPMSNDTCMKFCILFNFLHQFLRNIRLKRVHVRSTMFSIFYRICPTGKIKKWICSLHSPKYWFLACFYFFKIKRTVTSLLLFKVIQRSTILLCFFYFTLF